LRQTYPRTAGYLAGHRGPEWPGGG